MQEAQQHQDHRMVSGPAVASFIWFNVSEPMITFSADQDPKRRLAMWHDLTSASSIKLETTEATLDALEGGLTISRRWDDRYTSRGYLRRDGSNFYSVSLSQDEEEWDQMKQLLSWGFLPRALELQFDVEYEQHFDGEQYWDDVRYPFVDIDSYRIDWTRAGTAELRSRHYRG